jgi:hypothetical protein
MCSRSPPASFEAVTASCTTACHFASGFLAAAPVFAGLACGGLDNNGHGTLTHVNRWREGREGGWKRGREPPAPVPAPAPTPTPAPAACTCTCGCSTASQRTALPRTMESCRCPRLWRGRAIVAPRCREDGVEELNDEDDEANENLDLRASSSSSRKWCVAAESACLSSVLLAGAEAH